MNPPSRWPIGNRVGTERVRAVWANGRFDQTYRTGFVPTDRFSASNGKFSPPGCQVGRIGANHELTGRTANEPVAAKAQCLSEEQATLIRHQSRCTYTRSLHPLGDRHGGNKLIGPPLRMCDY